MPAASGAAVGSHRGSEAQRDKIVYKRSLWNALAAAADHSDDRAEAAKAERGHHKLLI